MSTLKTTNLQNASAASPAFVLAADGSATANLSSVNGGPLSGMRNRIINGSMVINQRATTTTTDGAFTVDRFAQSQSGGGVVSWAQSSIAPAGHTNSLGGTVTTADSSIASTDYYRVYQPIEGFNVADLASGTANASTITVSFWVRSSITGTYCVGFGNASFNRGYAAQYTISSANTWEYKTVSLTLDQSGTWTTNNTVGLYVYWDLGSGSAYNITANTWSAAGSWKTSSQTSWIATNGATFYITGVQLEPGSTATPFERRSFGQELMLAQRYYYRLPSGKTISMRATPYTSSFSMRMTDKYPVLMRTTPTISIISSAIGNQSCTSTAIETSTDTVQFEANTPNATAWGNPHYNLGYNASAEL